MSKLTTREIARAAGVSSATVSYALNGRSGVSEERRRHVLAVAEKLGYKPDAEMAKLMAHIVRRRTREVESTLGLITDFGALRTWEWNSSFRALWDGATARAHELGYSLEEFNYHEPGVSPKRLRSILRARGIQGLLFSMAPSEPGRLDFDFSGFACGQSGVCFLEPHLHLVIPDHYSNFIEVMKQVHVRGYRRVMLFSLGGAGERTDHVREGAYLYFCSIHPEMTPLPIYDTALSERITKEAYIRQYQPDVLIGGQDDPGPALIAQMPREFGFVNMNCSPGETDFAGMDRRLNEQAGCVVDMVVASLHRGEAGIPPVRKKVLVEGRFVPGPTLPVRKRTTSGAGKRVVA